MSLEAEISAFLDSQAKLNLPSIWEIPISQVRANSQSRFEYIGAKTEIAEIRDTYIPGPTADLHIRFLDLPMSPPCPRWFFTTAEVGL